MMEVHDLQPGTDKWLAFRKEHFPASDAPAMLGISPYKTRTELMHEMATGITPDIDPATQRRFDDGHRFEALARPLAEKIIGEELYPCVGSEGKLSASFDGLTIDDSVCWEHKTLSAAIPDPLTTDNIPEHYSAQMEQQMMLSGAERCLFHATRWDDDECTGEAYCWYEGDRDSRIRILQGWAQFEIDLEEYKRKLAAGEIEQAKPKLTGEAIMDLPALAVTATGMVTYSNLPEFKAAADQYIAAINTELVTDQDFANAKAAVKFCKATEEKLEVTKAAILAQTASIDEAIRTVSYIQNQLRDKRLMLDKLVVSEEAARKSVMVSEANVKYAEHVSGLQNEIVGVRLPLLLTAPNFAEAIKSKRLMSAMQEAIDTALRNSMFAADNTANDVRAKLAWCNEFAAGRSALFPDLQQLVGYDMDAFTALILSRIEKAKADEAAKLEAERARMQAEATAKAEREAAAKIAQEEARIRADERGKAAELAAQQGRIDAEVRAKYEVDQRGETTEATHAVEQATQLPQAPVASTPPIKERPSDEAIIQCVSEHFGVSFDDACDWIADVAESLKVAA